MSQRTRRGSAGSDHNAVMRPAQQMQAETTEAVKTVVGQSLRPVYVLLEGDAVETPPEARLSEEELIALVRSEFDAEEYVVESESGEPEAKEM